MLQCAYCEHTWKLDFVELQVERIKERVEEKEGIPPPQQRQVAT